MPQETAIAKIFCCYTSHRLTIYFPFPFRNRLHDVRAIVQFDANDYLSGANTKRNFLIAAHLIFPSFSLAVGNIKNFNVSISRLLRLKSKQAITALRYENGELHC